jgi:hypothetical protein
MQVAKQVLPFQKERRGDLDCERGDERGVGTHEEEEGGEEEGHGRDVLLSGQGDLVLYCFFLEVQYIVHYQSKIKVVLKRAHSGGGSILAARTKPVCC